MIEFKEQEVKKKIFIRQGLDKKTETSQAGRHLIQGIRYIQKI